MVDPAPAVICLTQKGQDLAMRIAASVGGVVHARAGRADGEVIFAEATAHIRDLFASGTPIVGLCAAGILIRSVAPLLSDKHTEPPVLAVAEDASAVIPLLGGHRGANMLAQSIAGTLGIDAAVTTASELVHGVALDDPPPGWRLTAADAAGRVAADIIAGAPAICSGINEHLEPLAALPNVKVGPFTQVRGNPMPAVQLSILNEHGLPDTDRSIWYVAQDLAVGVGCARNCPPEELRSLVTSAVVDASVSKEAISGVFSVDLKADETAMLDLANELDVSFRVFSAQDLEEETPRLANPSDVVFKEIGCHGVAEAAALRAAGPDAELIVPKRKSANATVAIARAPSPITSLPGRARGQVSLVGLGPGRADWRTPEASRMIAAADELVGYGFYIDLIGPPARGKPRKDFPLGGEEDRCRYALERAAEGSKVALICSGDAGIYAMGALVYELMARRENGVSDAARRVDVVTAPGITAMQAAAARIGAPLGHDFCAISLSDLLTPREDILRRLRAAAEGDFVTALYNPVSKRRRDLFVQTIAIMRGHRPAETPVILATSLGRPEERITHRTLATVDVDEVDMMTVVIVGSSQTRTVAVGGRPRLFTPRGYANKSTKQESAA